MHIAWQPSIVGGCTMTTMMLRCWLTAWREACYLYSRTKVGSYGGGLIDGLVDRSTDRPRELVMVWGRKEEKNLDLPFLSKTCSLYVVLDKVADDLTRTPRHVASLSLVVSLVSVVRRSWQVGGQTVHLATGILLQIDGVGVQSMKHKIRSHFDMAYDGFLAEQRPTSQLGVIEDWCHHAMVEPFKVDCT